MDYSLKLADIINIIAVLISPVVAVGVTLWWQARKEKRARKDQLFGTLMMHRGQSPYPPEMNRALNLIEIVFADDSAVITRWREYFDLLRADSSPAISNARGHKVLELLSAMSSALGYQSLSQVQIDKYYWPQGLVDQQNASDNLQKELLRVLKNTQSLSAK